MGGCTSQQPKNNDSSNAPKPNIKPKKLEVSAADTQASQTANNGDISPERSRKITKQATLQDSIVRDIHQDYEFIKQLGSGYFGSVRLARFLHSIGSERQYAIKSIDKSQVQNEKQLEYLRREVSILIQLDHPNIVKLYEVYEDNKYLHLVLEFCSGGELFEKIATVGRYSEVDAAHTIKQVLSAVAYLHSHGIVHRDLKPENFVYENDAADAELKLIDFGLSTKFMWGDAKAMESVVGSPQFVAPEVLKANYGQSCDVWSCGVLLYILLSGKFPFEGSNHVETFKAVLSKNPEMETEVWQKISKQAKQLIKSMIVKQADKRAKADQCLHHEWFETICHDEHIAVDEEVLVAMKSYHAKTQLQKEAMYVLANFLDLDELKDLRAMFHELDHTGCGEITYEDLQQALEEAGIPAAKDEILEIIKNIDDHDTGKINYSEFLAATLTTKVKLDEAHLWTVFKRFDVEDKGYITEENLEEVLHWEGKDMSHYEAQAIYDEVEHKADNKITFEEFKKMMLDHDV